LPFPLVVGLSPSFRRHEHFWPSDDFRPAFHSGVRREHRIASLVLVTAWE
jgi:hypothetical protein